MSTKPPAEIVALTKENARLRASITRTATARKFAPRKIVRRRGRDDTIRVLWPDTHSAHADPGAISAFLHDLKALDPHEVINLGDLVDCGGFLAAHHQPSYVAQMGYTYEEDIAAARRYLDIAQMNAPRAKFEYIEANHDLRIEKWCVKQAMIHQRDADFLRRAFAPEFLLDMKGRGIPYYRMSETYDGLTVPGAIRRGSCLYIHDPSFTELGAILGRFGTSVVFGHVHRSMSLVTNNVANGEIGAWSFGCLAKKQMYYMHTRPSAHVHGYGYQVVSRSGRFLTVSVPIIDGVSYLQGPRSKT